MMQHDGKARQIKTENLEDSKMGLKRAWGCEDMNRDYEHRVMF